MEGFFMSKGKLYLLLSAFIYGIVPVFAKYSYMGGANSVTLTFLRAALTLPLLFFMLRASGISLRLTKTEVVRITLLGSLGGAAPIILLYMSYDFISVGLASTLHFIYPLITVLANAFIYHERMKLPTLGAVVLVTIGIFMFADITSREDATGIMLALLSGIFYSFYVIYIDRSGLDSMSYIKLTFYMMIIMSIATLIFGLVVNGLSFDMNWRAWSIAGVISLLITLFAIPLFQAGVRHEGANMAGILSAAEPVVSIASGALFLGERIGMGQLAGAVVIFIGLMLVRK